MLHRTVKRFKDWVWNLWLGIKKSPGRTIERAKAVPQKWKLNISGKMEKIEEEVICKGKKVEAIGREWKAKLVEEAKKRQDAMSKALEKTREYRKNIFSHERGAGDGKSRKDVGNLKVMEKVKTGQDSVSNALEETQKNVKSISSHDPGARNGKSET